LNIIKFKIPVNVVSAWREIVANHDCESVTDFVESFIIEIPTTLYLVKERVDKLISQLDLSSKCEKLYIKLNDQFAKRMVQELKKDNIDKNHFLIYCVFKATKETFPDYVKKINEFYFSLPNEDDKKDDRKHPNNSSPLNSRVLLIATDLETERIRGLPLKTCKTICQRLFDNFAEYNAMDSASTVAERIQSDIEAFLEDQNATAWVKNINANAIRDISNYMEKGFYAQITKTGRDMLKDFFELLFQLVSCLKGHSPQAGIGTQMSLTSFRKETGLLNSYIRRKFTRNLLNYLIKENKLPIKLVSKEPKISRTFALRHRTADDLNKKASKKAEIDYIDKVLRPQFVKFKDIQNQLIEFVANKIKSNPSNVTIQNFSEKGNQAYNRVLYMKDSTFEIIGIDPNSYKSYKDIRFKKDMIKAACYNIYHPIRNWVAKLEDLKTISENTIRLLENDNFKRASLKSLLGRGTLSDNSLKILQKLLQRNIFGEIQHKSLEEVKNHLGQLKNLFITSKVLEVPLEGAINALRGDQSNRDNFSNLVLESFTKIVDKKETPIPPEEFSQYFAKRYFANFKRQTKDLALRKLDLGEPLKQNYFTAQFINGLVFGDIAGFKNISEFIKLRDRHIAAMEINNINFSSRVRDINADVLSAKVIEFTSSYLEYLIKMIEENPSISLTRILFKPRPSRFFYKSLDEEGFEEFIDHLLKKRYINNRH